MVKKTRIENPVIEKEDDSSYSVTGTVDGAPVACLVTVDTNKLVFVMATGRDMETLGTILESYEDK